MKVVVQQALYYHFNQPVSRIAQLAAINPRTAWNHVHAAARSHVKGWAKRSTVEQDSAIIDADQIMKGNAAMCHPTVASKRIRIFSSHRSGIPAGILHAMIDTEIAKRVQANDTFTAYSITLFIRAMNPNNEVVHEEVQARVRFIMSGCGTYELLFQNWNGQNARTWRPVQVTTVVPMQISVAFQAAQISTGIKIVDDE